MRERDRTHRRLVRSARSAGDASPPLFDRIHIAPTPNDHRRDDNVSTSVLTRAATFEVGSALSRGCFRNLPNVDQSIAHDGTPRRWSLQCSEAAFRATVNDYDTTTNIVEGVEDVTVVRKASKKPRQDSRQAVLPSTVAPAESMKRWVAVISLPSALTIRAFIAALNERTTATASLASPSSAPCPLSHRRSTTDHDTAPTIVAEATIVDSGSALRLATSFGVNIRGAPAGSARVGTLCQSGSSALAPRPAGAVAFELESLSVISSRTERLCTGCEPARQCPSARSSAWGTGDRRQDQSRPTMATTRRREGVHPGRQSRRRMAEQGREQAHCQAVTRKVRPDRPLRVAM